MLSRASFMLGRVVRVSSRPALSGGAPSSLSVRLFSYSNQNKPETKEAANEALTDAKAGKAAAEVQHHKATTGGQPLARESGAAGAKATKDNAGSSSQPVNRSDAGPTCCVRRAKRVTSPTSATERESRPALHGASDSRSTADCNKATRIQTVQIVSSALCYHRASFCISLSRSLCSCFLLCASSLSSAVLPPL